MSEMAETKVYVVTHGEKFSGPNPGMTPKGFQQVEGLRDLLPSNPPVVVSGTGRRHADVAKALGFTPDRFTACVGGSESLEVIEGRKTVLLADGTMVPREKYTTPEDGLASMMVVITGLPDCSIICAGRPSMIMLGLKDAKNASVYRVECENRAITLVSEVKTIGVSEEETV